MMGTPQLVWSSIKLRLVNQVRVSPIDRVPHLPVEVEGINTYTYFDVIEIVHEISSYLALFGIGWKKWKLGGY